MAATWAPIPGASRSVMSVQAGTEAAPALSTDGVDLSGLAAISVWLDAGPGVITAEGGQADIYQYEEGSGWGSALGLVLQVPPNAAGLRRVLLGTVTIDNPRGRVAPILNGVSVSGGSATVEVRVSTLSIRGPVPA